MCRDTMDQAYTKLLVLETSIPLYIILDSYYGDVFIFGV